MSVLYESWTESGGDWKKSKIYLQVTSTEKTKRMGVREWMHRAEIEKKYGVAGATAIINRKLSEPELKETEVRPHPEAPDVEELTQYLTLNMEKEVESNETCVSRLYRAAEEDSSSSDESGSDSDSSDSSSSDSAPKKSKKKDKKKKTKKKIRKRRRRPCMAYIFYVVIVFWIPNILVKYVLPRMRFNEHELMNERLQRVRRRRRRRPRKVSRAKIRRIRRTKKTRLMVKRNLTRRKQRRKRRRIGKGKPRRQSNSELFLLRSGGPYVPAIFYIYCVDWWFLKLPKNRIHESWSYLCSICARLSMLLARRSRIPKAMKKKLHPCQGLAITNVINEKYRLIWYRLMIISFFWWSWLRLLNHHILLATHGIQLVFGSNKCAVIPGPRNSKKLCLLTSKMQYAICSKGERPCKRHWTVMRHNLTTWTPGILEGRPIFFYYLLRCLMIYSTYCTIHGLAGWNQGGGAGRGIVRKPWKFWYRSKAMQISSC